LELSRLRFFWAAIWADFKNTKGWRIVTTFYLLSGIVMFVLRFFTTWTPAFLLSSWSGKAKWLLFFVYLCVGLILLLIAVVNGARRVYTKAANQLDTRLVDAKADFESRANRLEKLSEVHGSAHELLLQFNRDRDRPTVAALRYWAERLDKALYACYGLSGTDKFSRDGAYSIKVPEKEAEHSDWLYKNYQRLDDLIKEERPQ
jgi:hypothetical protein